MVNRPLGKQWKNSSCRMIRFLGNVVSQVKEIMSLEPKGFPRQIVYLLLEFSNGLCKDKTLPYHNLPCHHRRYEQIILVLLHKVIGRHSCSGPSCIRALPLTCLVSLVRVSSVHMKRDRLWGLEEKGGAHPDRDSGKA